MNLPDEELSRFGVVIQARTSSERLPGKVLMDIEGQPMLLRQLRRLRKGIKVDKLIVATSHDPSDDPIEELCRMNGFACYRGPLDDVMERFILLGLAHQIDYLIRVGGDDPLIDPECCNFLLDIQLRERFDFIYASNRSGWPYGCAAELISRSTLEDIRKRTSKPLYLEHIIPFFFDFPQDFKILRAEAPKAINRPDYCFSVDYPEDMELIRTIFRMLQSEGDYFPLEKVIELIDNNPSIRNINKHLHQGFTH
jgi:spore coat polysaccharide biosynthesis protein SpsF